MFIDIKSEWQKDNCINSNCKNDSRLELVCGNARIRFCGKLECLEVAKQLADKPMFGVDE
jgi:hypothetical protein